MVELVVSATLAVVLAVFGVAVVEKSPLFVNLYQKPVLHYHQIIQLWAEPSHPPPSLVQSLHQGLLLLFE